MRTIYHLLKIFFVLLLLHITLPSQVHSHYKTYKIIDNGEDENKLVWVIMGDGYTKSQLNKFHFDATEVLISIFSNQPWLNYNSYVNVYLIDSVSDESGADHPSHGIYVDTALDATYNAHGVNGLLGIDPVKAYDIAYSIPTFDMIMVLVNDLRVGGSSGSTVVISDHLLAGRIALHEVGHFVGGLADEYELLFNNSSPLDDDEPNVTFNTDIENIPWNKWIDDAWPLPTPNFLFWNIGIFEGASYCSSGIYRPRITCTMRNPLNHYCEICTEAIILNIYNYVDPIRSYTPNESILTFSPGEELKFQVDIEKPLNHALSVSWELDGYSLKGESKDVLSLDSSVMERGMYTIKVSVKDSTPLVRNDPHHLLSSTHSWILIKESSFVDYLTSNSNMSLTQNLQ